MIERKQPSAARMAIPVLDAGTKLGYHPKIDQASQGLSRHFDLFSFEFISSCVG